MTGPGPAAKPEEITIGVPGSNRTVTMRAPEWVELASGWQLGGLVKEDQANTLGELYGADRVILTHSAGPPEFVSLRSRCQPPTSRGIGWVYLRIPAAHGPRNPDEA